MILHLLHCLLKHTHTHTYSDSELIEEVHVCFLQRAIFFKIWLRIDQKATRNPSYWKRKPGPMLRSLCCVYCEVLTWWRHVSCSDGNISCLSRSYHGRGSGNKSHCGDKVSSRWGLVGTAPWQQRQKFIWAPPYEVLRAALTGREQSLWRSWRHITHIMELAETRVPRS